MRTVTRRKKKLAASKIDTARREAARIEDMLKAGHTADAPRYVAVKFTLDKEAFIEQCKPAEERRQKHTEAEVRADAKRIADATRAPKPTPRKPLKHERMELARFAAEQLVTGKSIMLSDDAVLAMAQLIHYTRVRL